MIKLTRLNKKEYFINPNLIETIEETPDTVLKLTTEKTLIVREKAPEIISRIIAYNRQIFLEKSRIE